MDKIIESILQATKELRDALEKEDYDELDRLLAYRQTLMAEADEYKAANPDFNFSSKNKECLKEALLIDQELEGKLKDYLSRNIVARGRMKEKNKAARKYENYQNLTNGSFIDTLK